MFSKDLGCICIKKRWVPSILAHQRNASCDYDNNECNSDIFIMDNIKKSVVLFKNGY